MKFIGFFLLLTMSIFGQSLSKQRIWKIVGEKRSVYFDKGIFHSPIDTSTQKLLGVRNSYVKSRGFERVVFDFSSDVPPRLYGHISPDKKRVYLDFLNTNMDNEVKNIKKVKYVKGIDFFDIDKNTISVELNVSSKTSFDIFYLESPARIVVDIKK
ncbi:MAG: hypothetical protein N4A33_09845 [Bacteriovoracaceae bacterium]|jgi:hypothetical protein|nr:hypothetical protein [Bacteriovoracaceae bacterium]